MADTITHSWQTVEQAAVTLNVSTRTIARRLASGSLESRVDENGRRLVMVQQIGTADAGDTDADFGNGNGDLLAEIDDHAAIAQAVPAGPSSQAMTMLTVLQSTVTAARDDATAARRTARWAWAGVGVMTLAIFAGAIVLTGTVTRSTVTTTLLQGQLAETKTELRQTQAELMATRTAEAHATRDLTAARREADTQRRLAEREAADRQSASASIAVRQNIDGIARPTTRPQSVSLLERMVSLFGE